MNPRRILLWTVAILLAGTLVSARIIAGRKQAGWVAYTERNSRISGVTAIGFDQGGRAWIGTFDEGVSVYDGGTWTHFTQHDSGLASDNITAIAIDSRDRIWIGTNGGGVSVLDRDVWTNYSEDISGLADRHITAIAIDGHERAWIATGDAGVSVYDGEGWTGFNVGNAPLSDNRINTIAIDDQGRVWMAPYLGDLSVWDHGSWTTYPVGTHMGGIVNDIAFDSQGSAWIATGGGLGIFDGEGWTEYAGDGSPSPRYVNAIAIDRYGRAWVGADDGLIVEDMASSTAFTQYNSGLVGDFVTEISLDQKGGVWIGTTEGLSVASSEQIAPIPSAASGFLSSQRLLIAGLVLLWCGAYFRLDTRLRRGVMAQGRTPSRFALPIWAIVPIWVAISGIAWLVGSLASFLLALPIGHCPLVGFVPSSTLHSCGSIELALFGPINGVVLAALQSIALRRSLARPRRWFFATLMGCTIAFPTIAALQYKIGSLLLSEGELGFLSPVTQGGALDQASFHFVPIGSALSGGALVAIVFLLALTGFLQWLVLRRSLEHSYVWMAASAVENVVTFLVQLPLGAAVTGLTIYWLLSRPLGKDPPLAAASPNDL